MHSNSVRDWDRLVRLILEERTLEGKRRLADQLNASLRPLNETIFRIQETARQELHSLEQKLKETQAMTGQTRDLET